MWTYVIIWGISLAIISIALKSSDSKNDISENSAVLGILLLAPLLAIAFATAFFLRKLWAAATYFSAENRYERKLKKAHHERELWEAEHGISLDDVDDILNEVTFDLDEETNNATTETRQYHEQR